VFTDSVTGGTLREAILNANNDPGTATDTIQLAAGTYTLTIPNAGNKHEVQSMQGDLNITSTAHALVIQGAADADGRPTTVIRQTAADRVFQVLNLGGGLAASVTFQNLIIEGGFAQDNGSADAVAGKSGAQGGGILSTGGNVALSNVVVQSNQATAGDTKDAFGGGIYVQAGSLTINGSVIRNNTATGGAGAGDSYGGIAYGGGVCLTITGNPGTQLSITNSTVAGNIVQGGRGSVTGKGGGGTANGGGVFSIANRTIITGSTLSGNKAIGGQAGQGTDAGYGVGGGASLLDSSTVVNSTIALNSATGDGAFGGGVFYGGYTGQFTNVTVAGNQANRFGPVGSVEGGGFLNNNEEGEGVTLVNTLVVGNTTNSGDNSSGPDLKGKFISGGHNLIGIAEGANAPGFTAPGDRTGTAANPLDPKLGPLQNNGGPTQTMLPLPGSPLLGSGNASLAPATDQRGLSRPTGGPTDIGAAQVTGVGGGSSSSRIPVGQLMAFALGFVNGQLDIFFVDQRGQVFGEAFNFNNFFSPSPADAQFLNTDMVFRNMTFSDAVGYPAVLGSLVDSGNQNLLMVTIPLGFMSQTALNDVIAALQASGL
jgi:hypothetical protein